MQCGSSHWFLTATVLVSEDNWCNDVVLSDTCRHDIKKKADQNKTADWKRPVQQQPFLPPAQGFV